MDFVQVSITAPTELVDILTAELSQYGYDTFMETEEGIAAYTTEDIFSEADVISVLERYNQDGQLAYVTQKIEKQNWNAEWEKNFEPLLIGNVCSVRASFHPQPENVQYDIIINPKMSFGTGHHETTTLMIENQLTINHLGKRVLDMGCGTGILAIMACKLGAASIVAIDIEDWTVENARENAEINNCSGIEVRLGDVQQIAADEPYDLVLANINRNVLLDDIPAYSAKLQPGGFLVISGFYTEDLDLIQDKAQTANLEFTSVRTKNNWVSAVFRKRL
ncbi:50S ribosomal protein L11 methyltransferase [Adhaeribacter swui]|uniref:Ribosomal protein L11 methyltransferase n=1 Tax=Adhaeribacter swui TaxID=2086471 RepID=A0A7G7G4E0_9BACT|nr:50S ribosomal protein L11 methyltransferase [Adhaeribacter swui]QNF32024.1 50S ribosomal protein L11 methyltransferase [Adhaeribacter swui]